MSEPPLITDYNPAWPRQFELERASLSRVFAGTDALLEHMGSTAVPGLCAKPVIDIMLGVPDLALIEARVPALALK